MRNSSLDEFVGGADGDESDAERADGETADPGGEGDAGSGSVADPDADPELESATGAGQEEGADRDAQADGSDGDPVVSTLDWRPSGAPCAACGQPSERRWRDDGDLVCSSCKTW